MINRAGDKVSAEEVEDHLRAHPGVAGVAIVPVADAALGERSCACIIASGQPPRLSELTAFLRDRELAAYTCLPHVRAMS
ncbi:AMP-binding enzyme [Frankia sp. CcWB2]